MGLSSFWSSIAKYKTSKTVKIKSKKLFIVYMFVMLGIFTTTLGYVIIYEKNYQREEIGIGGTRSEVKGVAYMNSGRYPTLWDADDLTYSLSESNILLGTNRISFGEQIHSICPESPSQNASCQISSDCESRGRSQHGYMNGKCNNETQTCEIHGWCPVVDEISTIEQLVNTSDIGLVRDIETLVVHIDSRAYFPELNKTASYSQEFTLYEIVKLAHKNMPQFNTLEGVWLKGGIISIKITWNCDFDKFYEPCRPKFSFDRLDTTGHRFKFIMRYYRENGRKYRRPSHWYGIRFMILEDVEGRQFSFLTCALSVGSTLGYFSLATVICDKIAEYCMEDSYKRRKFEKTEKIKFRHCLRCSTTEAQDQSEDGNGIEAVSPKL